MKPKADELEDAEKRPKLFEPAAGPPPKVGEEELAAEGSGQEILLQVGLVLQDTAGCWPYTCFAYLSLLHGFINIAGSRLRGIWLLLR